MRRISVFRIRIKCTPRGAYAPCSSVAVRMSANEKAIFAMYIRIPQERRASARRVLGPSNDVCGLSQITCKCVPQPTAGSRQPLLVADADACAAVHFMRASTLLIARLAHASRSWTERVGCTKAMVTARALPFARQRSHSQFVSPQTRNQPRLTRLQKVSAALAAALFWPANRVAPRIFFHGDASAPFFAPAARGQVYVASGAFFQGDVSTIGWADIDLFRAEDAVVLQLFQPVGQPPGHS
jgi:hypothetical protein